MAGNTTIRSPYRYSIGCSLVLVTLLIASPLAMAATPYQGEGHMMVTPSDLEWGPVGSMAPGAKISIIEGDLSKEEPFTMRLKLPADYEIAPHIHPAYERVTVLSGTFHFAHGKEIDRDKASALPEGSVAIMSPGDPMFGYTEEEVVIQLHGTGPWGIEYLNPEDDPRK
ncbi:cupin domain-containing protein [Marinobacter sp. TBZ242]|uniref:Cupin domain-containing protein n=1 Tax=Marinobacter azerbaijanicus TaxID=3050455 RepID=A0ABT7I8C9_9GAMM|nr:cupin domain-containing protein [Marinobacter sp. TBZ242]MDL0430417.1 cupin domain-containing protein [Marinobacter sp. TBZ242]